MTFEGLTLGNTKSNSIIHIFGQNKFHVKDGELIFSDKILLIGM